LERQIAETVEVAWEGDSLDMIRRFPGPVKQDLGAELRKLQEGDRPIHSRPMPSIGVRVYELNPDYS
jgi:phage-related protein